MSINIIDALTGLNEATAEYEKSVEELTASNLRRQMAESRLNSMQESFDRMVGHLHQNAPKGTRWHMNFPQDDGT